VAGRKVFQNGRGHFGAGRHLLRLDPSSVRLISGVYILRAEMEGKTLGSARIVVTE